MAEIGKMSELSIGKSNSSASTCFPLINRNALIERIDQEMTTNLSILMISPQFTGKTTLANQMNNFWKAKAERKVCYISFASLYRSDSEPEVTQAELDELFQLHFKSLPHQIISSDVYLILDDVQNVYHLSSFWCCFVSGVQHCRLLAFGDFGLNNRGEYSSPDRLRTKWYYEDIKFSDTECAELVEVYCQAQPTNRDFLVPELTNYLFQFLNNHPGLLQLALHTICHVFRQSPYNSRTHVDVQKLIADGKLSFELFKARCFDISHESIRQIIGPESEKLVQTGVVSKRFFTVF